MEFIGREVELEMLETEYAKENSYVALIGRQGFGQSALLNRFASNKKVFHFSAMIEIESQCIRRFVRDMAMYTGEEYLKDKELETWESAFQALAEYKSDEKKLIILDDVQFLIEANRDFFRILRKCWDDYMADKRIMLITAGPLMTTTVQYYFAKDGLFKDGVVKGLRLRAFYFLELRTHHPSLNFSQLTELYTITGGVPKYLDMFGHGFRIMDDIEEQVMRKSGYHYEMPLQLLEKEVREPATYFSILNVIAEGNNKLLDIARALRLKTNSLGPYLSLLIKLNLIERRIPVTEASPDKSRKGMYAISDHFADFWFKFISPNRVVLEEGNSAYVRKIVEDNYVESLIHPSYIKISREIFTSLCNQGKIKFVPDKIGSHWNGDNTSMIDLIAIDTKNKRLFVADCFFLPEGGLVPSDAFGELARKLANISELAGYKEVYYGFFTNRDFHPALKALARDDTHVKLIQEIDLI